MPLQYTTVEAIADRLRGRLDVERSALGGGMSGLAAQQVNPRLLERIGSQVEARLNIALAQIYSLPVPEGATTARIILGGIVEKLVISEIVQVHFQQTQAPQMGGDMGFGSVIRKQALEELEALFAGHGVYIPGLMPAPVATPGTYRQPLVLPGVPLKSDLVQPDTLTRMYVAVEQREGVKLTDEETIDFGFPTPTKRRRLGRGLEDPYQSGWSDVPKR